MSASPAPTILHYLGYNHDGGGIVTVVRTLADEGRFACVLGVAPGFAPERATALPTVVFPELPAEELGLKALWRARLVADAAERWLAAAPDRVFHAHSRGGLAAALWLQRRGQRRVVASVHCYGARRWFYRWAARQLGDRLFWLTPAMKHYYGVAVGRDAWAQCIPGCVRPVAAPRTGSSGREIVRLGGIGSLVSWKRWHLVLDAIARMPAEQRWKIRFSHLGAPDTSGKSQRYALALRTQTGALSLGNLVTWHGAEPSSARLLRDVDVLVVPSHREPLSVAMIEALAAGVPVLAANSGGSRDAIVSSKNGWLFRSGDPRDLARALVMLVESDALRTVQPVPKPDWRFYAPAVAEQWMQVYPRVLESASPNFSSANASDQVTH